MLSASSRARSTPIRSSSAASSWRRLSDLPALRLQPGPSRLLGAAPLLQTGQPGAQRGMLFPDFGRLRPQALHLFPHRFERTLLLQTHRLLLRDALLGRRALRLRALLLPRQTPQFEARHREARVRLRGFVGELADLMIEGQRFFFLSLLECAQPLHLLFEKYHLTVQVLEQG